MASEFPRLKLLAPIEGHDDPARTEPLVARLLKRERELAAIYSIGAGNRGIDAALRASGARRPRRLGLPRAHRRTPGGRCSTASPTR